MAFNFIAKIKGKASDLVGLSKLFDGADDEHTVIKAHKFSEGRGHLNTNGWLTSDLLVTETREVDALAIAEGIVSRINGFVRLHDLKFRPIAVMDVQGHNGENSAHFTKVTFDPPSRFLTHIGPSDRTATINGLMQLANQKPEVEFALQLLNQPITWPLMYVLYEVIKTDVGGAKKMVDLGFLSSSEQGQLTEAANNNRNVRTGVRHGNRPGRAQHELIPQVEGHKIILKVVWKWLRHLGVP